VGKPWKVPSSLDRLKKQQIQIKEIQALHRNRNTPRPVASTAFSGTSAGSSQGGTGNFLRTVGDTMIGPLALAPPVDFRVQIDSDGIIDIGESSDNSQYSSNIQLDDIQPNTFVLDTIGGSAFDGQILVIRTFAPSIPFTISQATMANGGNIQTLNDADFTVGDLRVMTFIFDASLLVFTNTGGTWREITGDDTGGGGGGGDVFLANTQTFTGVNTFENHTIFGATGPFADNGLQRFANDVIFAAGRTGGNDGNIELKFTTQDEFDLTNSNNSAVKLLLRAQDPIDPDNLFLISQNSGSAGNAFLTASNNLTILTGLATANVLFSPTRALFGTDISLNTNEIFLDASENSGIVSVIDNLVATFTNNVVRFIVTDTQIIYNVDMNIIGSNIIGVVDLGFFQAGQSIVSLADPTGGLQYNVNNSQPQAHIFRSGTTEIARLEEATAGVYRFDLLDHQIKDAKHIAFDVGATFSGAGAVPVIGYDSGTSEFRFNAPATTSFSWTFNNTERMSLSDGFLTFKDGTLVIFNPDAVNAGVNVGIVSGDPSFTTVGDLWYNFTTDKLRTNENSVNVDVVGGGGISFPIDFPEDNRGTVGASTQDILFTDSDRHSVKMIVSGNVDLAFSSPPTNETAYTNIIIVQDGAGGHTVTVPVGTVNKAIVDAGILTDPNRETGIVIKFAFGVFYAFLETGNNVSGGGGGGGDVFP